MYYVLPMMPQLIVVMPTVAMQWMVRGLRGARGVPATSRADVVLSSGHVTAKILCTGALPAKGQPMKRKRVTSSTAQVRHCFAFACR
jgi:hypothetical protein